MNRVLIPLIILSFFLQVKAQEFDFGTLYRFQLSNAPFPHVKRAEGHTYNNQLYPEEIHYNDSTTLVFIPDYVSLESEFDIVVYFHGWFNNVDSVLSQFNLIEQFHGSCREAILVMPEGPKNAPDSFGGKLEEAGRFNSFIQEVITKLQTGINQPLTFRNIILAGHSGAYRVMSFILLHGGLTDKISEVYLFDGLYADIEKYSYWLDHYNGRFINIYTPNGGTKYASENLMLCLNAWNIPLTFIDDDEFTNVDLEKERIVFISSALSHKEVIGSQDQFMRFLYTGE